MKRRDLLKLFGAAGAAPLSRMVRDDFMAVERAVAPAETPQEPEAPPTLVEDTGDVSAATAGDGYRHYVAGPSWCEAEILLAGDRMLRKGEMLGIAEAETLARSGDTVELCFRVSDYRSSSNIYVVGNWILTQMNVGYDDLATARLISTGTVTRLAVPEGQEPSAFRLIDGLRSFEYVADPIDVTCVDPHDTRSISIASLGDIDDWY